MITHSSTAHTPPTAPLWRRLLPKALQIAVTLFSLAILAASYVKWDNRKLQREIARKIRLGDEGKGFRELASPVAEDTSNFCAIPCLKDSAGGTGNEERDAIVTARVKDLFSRVKKATSDIKITALCEDPKTHIQTWATHFRATVPPAPPDAIPANASNSAFVLATLNLLLPELDELLDASNRPNAQWTPALRIRKFKGPVQFAQNQQPNLSLGLAKLLGALSVVYLEENAPDKATRCIQAIIKIADANFDEPLYISSLVAVSVLRSAHDPIRLALSSEKITIHQIEDISSCLQKIRPIESYAKASSGEAAIGLEFIDSLDELHIQKAIEDQTTTIPTAYRPLLFAFSGAPMKNLALRTLLDQLAHETPFSSEGMPAHLRRISDWQNATHSPLQDLTEKLFPLRSARLSVARTAATAEAQLHLVRLACAIEMHRRSKNKLPSSLNELPSTILSTNEDPLAARPMRFKAVTPLAPTSSFRLWSVGLDLKDDNGEIEQTKLQPSPNTPGGDIIWNSSFHHQ